MMKVATSLPLYHCPYCIAALNQPLYEQLYVHLIFSRALCEVMQKHWMYHGQCKVLILLGYVRLAL